MSSNCALLARLSLWLMLLSYCAFGFQANANFNHVTDAQGNKINNVRKMTFDQNGFLWFGGDSGVYRFDGYALTQVNKEPTRGLYLDRQQRFWSTGTTTLLGLDPVTFHSIEYPNLSTNPTKTEQEIVHQMYQTPDGRQFFATNEGLSEYFYQQDKFSHYDVVTQDKPTQKLKITRLLATGKNHLLIGSTTGLYRIELSQINQSSQTLTVDSPLLSSVSIRDLSYHKQQLLVGSNNGLYVLDQQLNQLNHFTHQKDIPQSLSNNNVTRVLADDLGYIWVGTSKGLNLLSPDFSKLKRFMYNSNDPNSLSNNLITDLHQDNSGNIFIATYSGIERFNHANVHLSPYEHLLNSGQNLNNVWSMAQTNSGDLWIGTFGSGLTRLSSQGAIESYNPNADNPTSLISSRVSSLFIDHNEQLYVGTTQGLQTYDPTTNSFKLINLTDTQQDKSSKTIFDIAQADDNSIWLATSNGIIHKDGNMVTFYDKHSPLPIQYKQWVRSVLPLQQLILVGSDKGLHIIDRKNNRVKQIDDIGSVIKLYQDSDNNIWVLGMTSVGLFNPATLSIAPFVQPQQTFSNVDAPAGGCNTAIEDQFKQLWMICGDHLKVVDIKHKRVVARYNKADNVDLSGFLTGAQSLILANDGQLLLGERQGIGAFTPTKQPHDQQQANLALTHVEYHFGKPLDDNPQQPFGFVQANTEQPPSLDHSLHKIEFQFSSLDMTRPKDFEYRYKLEGYDQHWTITQADNRRAIYTNLPSGNYQFKLETLAPEKTKNAIVMPFSITTAPSRSWWAYLLYLLLIITLVYLLIILRTKALRVRQIALEQRIVQRTRELELSKQEVEQLMLERQKLIENIYHQTRTPLQIMLGNINALTTQQLSIDEYASKQTDKVNALVHLTDQILDVSRVNQIEQDKLEVIDLSALIKPMIMGISDVAKAKQIQFSWNIDEGLNVKGSAKSLENAIDNIISNAIKYTPNHGAIRFSAKQQDHDIIIQCSDTGIGIPKDEQAQVFTRYQRASNSQDHEGAGIGLAMVQDVIIAIGGQIELNSEENKGTTVKITLPEIPVPSQPEVPEFELLGSQLETQTNEVQNDKDHRPTVLVVEDNLELVNYMATLLADHYQVFTALNGQDGLKQARDTVPDLIISDVMMAPMDGYQLTSQIRQDEITCHIPILLVTAKSDENSKEQGFALGASDFINKPFKAPDLLNRVSNQLLQIKALQNRFKQNSDSEETQTTEVEEDRLITRYLQFVSKHYQDNDLKIKDACGSLHISIRQLERKVRHYLDMTPNELLNDYRLSRAKELLNQGYNGSHVFEQCGFSSHAYFSKRFKEKFGHLPSQHKAIKRKT